MSETKTIGIVCDNYKLQKFKIELAAAGYSNIETTTYQTKPLTVISIVVPSSEFGKHQGAIAVICARVEKHFMAIKS